MVTTGGVLLCTQVAMTKAHPYLKLVQQIGPDFAQVYVDNLHISHNASALEPIYGYLRHNLVSDRYLH